MNYKIKFNAKNIDENLAEMKMEMKNSLSQFKNSGQGEAYQ